MEGLCGAAPARESSLHAVRGVLNGLATSLPVSLRAGNGVATVLAPGSIALGFAKAITVLGLAISSAVSVQVGMGAVPLLGPASARFALATDITDRGLFSVQGAPLTLRGTDIEVLGLELASDSKSLASLWSMTVHGLVLGVPHDLGPLGFTRLVKSRPPGGGGPCGALLGSLSSSSSAQASSSSGAW